MRVTGGIAAPAATLAPKIGPLGMSPKKVGDDIMAATKQWMGLKCTVQLTVLNRQATVCVVPAASSLIIKELKEPFRDRKKVKNITHGGNVTLEAMVKIAQEMRFKSQARHLVGTLKECLGTAHSVGCTVNGQHPTDVIAALNDGKITVDDDGNIEMSE